MPSSRRYAIRRSVDVGAQMLSMNSRSGAPSAPASALKRPSQMPRSAQRTKQYRTSSLAHTRPRSPLSDRPTGAHERSRSARGLPRTSVGSKGAIRSYCAPENQKKSATSTPPR